MEIMDMVVDMVVYLVVDMVVDMEEIMIIIITKYILL